MMGTCMLGIINSYPDSFSSAFTYTIECMAYLIGSMISESYYSRFSERTGILFLWISFSVSVLLISLLSISNSIVTFILAHLGLALFSISTVLLYVVEIGYLTSYMKSNPETYALSLLMILNQIPICLYYIIGELDFIWTWVAYGLALLISIRLTWGLTGKPMVYTTEYSNRLVILPFSAFVVEYYTVGVWGI